MVDHSIMNPPIVDLPTLSLELILQRQRDRLVPVQDLLFVAKKLIREVMDEMDAQGENNERTTDGGGGVDGK